MDNLETPTSNWRLGDETAYCVCELCRQINPPIYEVIYQLRSCAQQYNYFCTPCAIKKVGKAVFGAGLRAAAERLEVRQQTMTNARTSKKSSEQ